MAARLSLALMASVSILSLGLAGCGAQSSQAFSTSQPV